MDHDRSQLRPGSRSQYAGPGKRDSSRLGCPEASPPFGPPWASPGIGVVSPARRLQHRGNRSASSATLTMSSREIAELTGKLHHHVIRDIKVMLDDLGEVTTKFGGYYTAPNGKQNPCFNLPKRETLILVSGYSVIE